MFGQSDMSGDWKVTGGGGGSNFVLQYSFLCCQHGFASLLRRGVAGAVRGAGAWERIWSAPAPRPPPRAPPHQSVLAEDRVASRFGETLEQQLNAKQGVALEKVDHVGLCCDVVFEAICIYANSFYVGVRVCRSTHFSIAHCTVLLTMFPL